MSTLYRLAGGLTGEPMEIGVYRIPRSAHTKCIKIHVIIPFHGVLSSVTINFYRNDDDTIITAPLHRRAQTLLQIHRMRVCVCVPYCTPQQSRFK